MSERFKLVGAVLNIILKDNEVLMLLRKNKFDAGLYSLPGGCMESGETVKEAAAREIKEETNLDVDLEQMNIVSSLHRICLDKNNAGWQSIEHVVVSNKFNGTPTVMEPDKSDELKWFPLNNLPKNISPYANKAIDNYINLETFSEIDY